MDGSPFAHVPICPPAHLRMYHLPAPKLMPPKKYTQNEMNHIFFSMFFLLTLMYISILWKGLPPFLDFCSSSPLHLFLPPPPPFMIRLPSSFSLLPSPWMRRMKNGVYALSLSQSFALSHSLLHSLSQSLSQSFDQPCLSQPLWLLQLSGLR